MYVQQIDAVCSLQFLRHASFIVDPGTGKRRDGVSGANESAKRSTAAGVASAAAQQRERDFSDLRDRKDDVVSWNYHVVRPLSLSLYLPLPLSVQHVECMTPSLYGYFWDADVNKHFRLIVKRVVQTTTNSLRNSSSLPPVVVVNTTTTQADFLLKPRTPEELLTFCRRTLGLEFPSDSPDAADLLGKQPEDTGYDKVEDGTERITPPTNSNLGGDRRSRGSTSSSTVYNKDNSSINSRGSSTRNKRPRGIDDAAVAVDVARAVLAWGKPFRKIETVWRAAAVGQSYSVVSPLPSVPPPPIVSTLVLCSAREVLKGEPCPFLRPGTVGPPLAVDVTVEDVRLLKDEWDTSW